MNDLFVPQVEFECKRDCNERGAQGIEMSISGIETGTVQSPASSSNLAVYLAARFDQIHRQSIRFINQEENPVAADARRSPVGPL